MRNRFGDHLLDSERRELHRGATAIALEPQVFDLLTYLIANRDRVVSKDEVLDTIWAGRSISESTLTSRIAAARRAIGDSGEAQTAIRTVARKGFRFILAVDAEAIAAPPPTALPAAAPLIASTPRLSLAALPFGTSDAEAAAFANGLVDSITTDLSTHVPGLFVVARDSATAGVGGDPRLLGQALGVRYLLQGSVQRLGAAMRVTARLTEAESAGQLWAERFDGAWSDLFDVQDRITARVASAVAMEIVEAAARASATGEGADALDHVLRARSVENRPVTPATLTEAETLYRAALALDPATPRPGSVLPASWHGACGSSAPWWA